MEAGTMKKAVLILALLLLSSLQASALVYGATTLSVSILPTSIILGVGQSQSFTSTVTGGSAPYSYQWILDGNLVFDRLDYIYTASATGSHTLYLKVIDDAQNQAMSNTVNIVVSSASATMTVTELTLEPLSYKPTRITFNYQYTNNHTIGSISTIGHGDYSHSGGPTFMEFIAKDVDDYSFTVELQYTNATKQTVLIGLISGTMSVQGMGLTGNTEVFRIYIRLRVTEQPSYPSKEELAKEYMRQTEQILVEQAETNRQLLEENRNTGVVVSSLSVITTILVMVCFVLTALTFRTRRPMEG